VTLARDYLLGCVRFAAVVLGIGADRTAEWAHARIIHR
jgi:hypothetical protein